MAPFILVTGGAGFLGSHIVDRLLLEGAKVRVLDNFSSGRLENLTNYVNDGRVEIMNADLKNAQAALNAVSGVDAVFHFAANPEVRVSTTNPDIHFNENVVATFNLLEAMRKNDVKQLVFASSSSVYGEPEKIPVDENAPIRPLSVYGASKAACENLIHAYTHLYGVRAVAVRYANVVGPRLRHGVIYDFIKKLLSQPDKLEILGDGTQLRSYIHVSDAVEATIIIWRNMSDDFEVYNVGSEDWISVREVAEVVTSVMGLKEVKYAYKPILHGVGWPGDVKRIALAIDKVKGLGWRPRMKSREAVSKTVRSILEEFKNHENRSKE